MRLYASKEMYNFFLNFCATPCPLNFVETHEGIGVG